MIPDAVLFSDTGRKLYQEQHRARALEIHEEARKRTFRESLKAIAEEEGQCSSKKPPARPIEA